MDFTKLINQASDLIWGLIEDQVTERLNAKAEEIEKKLGMTEGEVIEIVENTLDYSSKLENAIDAYMDGFSWRSDYTFRDAVEEIVKDEMSDALDDEEIIRVVKDMVAGGEFVINAEITLDTM